MDNVKLVRSPTARRVALRADPARAVICLVIPKRTSEKTAWRFAHENRDWIEERLGMMEKPVPFVDGAVIPVFGIDRTLRIKHTQAKTTEIVLGDDTLDVYTSRPDPSANIKQFLWKMMEETARRIAHKKAAQINKSITHIQMRDTRARWGSCRADGKMMFCWRLIFAPMVVIDYVIGHECAHLVHMNHSPKFWKLCDELSKDMAYSRAWLDAKGDLLMMYGLER